MKSKKLLVNIATATSLTVFGGMAVSAATAFANPVDRPEIKPPQVQVKSGAMATDPTEQVVSPSATKPDAPNDQPKEVKPAPDQKPKQEALSEPAPKPEKPVKEPKSVPDQKQNGPTTKEQEQPAAKSNHTEVKSNTETPSVPQKKHTTPLHQPQQKDDEVSSQHSDNNVITTNHSSHKATPKGKPSTDSDSVQLADSGHSDSESADKSEDPSKDGKSEEGEKMVKTGFAPGPLVQLALGLGGVGTTLMIRFRKWI